nr:rhotekin-2 isoform X2 [Zonotrichia albicollis]
MNFELRMREGICRLLAVSTQREQLLRAVKNLLVCNARIRAYRAQLQAPGQQQSSENGTKDRTACRARVAISDIRIPLMWKGSDHFSKKEKSQRCAVFCLFSMGAQVLDTELTLVDEAITDICFENVTIFGAKFSLLAYTTLGLESAEDNFRTHNLTITGNEESSFWLPLYGNMCCRLVVQPSCMARDMMAGFLNQQQMVGGLTSWRRLYCVLRGGKLLCYYSPEEIEAKVEPALTVSINKETRIRAVDKDSSRRANNFSVINPVSGEGVTQRFAADSRDELHQWMEAFWQHFYDLSQWKHCCEELMKIEIMSPRKPPLFLTKEATSVYHDMSIDSPVKPEGLADIIHRKIEESDGEFLLGQQQEPASALWASLFDGAHEMTVHKNTHPDPQRDATSPSDSRGKKRRAPPPPSDKSPYSAEAQVNTEQLGKENWGKPDHTPASSSSFGSVLATKMQQLQTPIAPPRKIGLCGQSGLAGLGNPVSLLSKSKSETKPVPTPRHKGITEILDPRSWLHP